MTVTDEDKSFRKFYAWNIFQAIHQLCCHRKLQYAAVFRGIELNDRWTHEAIRGVRVETYISVWAMKKAANGVRKAEQ